jgi:hypothetical protein
MTGASVTKHSIIGNKTLDGLKADYDKIQEHIESANSASCAELDALAESLGLSPPSPTDHFYDQQIAGGESREAAAQVAYNAVWHGKVLAAETLDKKREVLDAARKDMEGKFTPQQMEALDAHLSSVNDQIALAKARGLDPAAVPAHIRIPQWQNNADNAFDPPIPELGDFRPIPGVSDFRPIPELQAAVFDGELSAGKRSGFKEVVGVQQYGASFTDLMAVAEGGGDAGSLPNHMGELVSLDPSIKRLGPVTSDAETGLLGQVPMDIVVTGDGKSILTRSAYVYQPEGAESWHIGYTVGRTPLPEEVHGLPKEELANHLVVRNMVLLKTGDLSPATVAPDAKHPPVRNAFDDLLFAGDPTRLHKPTWRHPRTKETIEFPRELKELELEPGAGNALDLRRRGGPRIYIGREPIDLDERLKE